MFHDTRERFGGSSPDTRCLDFLLFWSRGNERGRFLPTAPDAIEPLTPLSLLPRRRMSEAPSRSARLSSFPREEVAKTTRDPPLVKGLARDDPRCLPSTRTLRRIRWPFSPESATSASLLARRRTAERRSRATLGLARSCTVVIRRSPRHQHRFARCARRRFTADDSSG